MAEELLKLNKKQQTEERMAWYSESLLANRQYNEDTNITSHNLRKEASRRKI